ncbi:MAG: hypothetical protein ABIP29_02055 [Candidatus Eisenbacteria bacterium]
MPICPECRTPYEPGVVVCRSCRVPLVDSADDPGLLQPAGGGGETEWVELAEVCTVPNGVTAAMWKGALESQGLHPVVRSHSIPAYGEVLRDWTTRAWGSLLVPDDELAEARLVLEDFLATAETRGSDEDDDEGTDPGLDDRAGDP